MLKLPYFLLVPFLTLLEPSEVPRGHKLFSYTQVHKFMLNLESFAVNIVWGDLHTFSFPGSYNLGVYIRYGYVR
jgi:hypothetical protein